MRAKVLNKNITKFEDGKHYVFVGDGLREDVHGFIELIKFNPVEVKTIGLGVCIVKNSSVCNGRYNGLEYSVRPEWCYEVEKRIEDGGMMYDENNYTYISGGF